MLHEGSNSPLLISQRTSVLGNTYWGFCRETKPLFFSLVCAIYVVCCAAKLQSLPYTTSSCVPLHKAENIKFVRCIPVSRALRAPEKCLLRPTYTDRPSGVSAKHFSASPQDRSKPFLHNTVYENDFRDFCAVST